MICHEGDKKHYPSYDAFRPIAVCFFYTFSFLTICFIFTGPTLTPAISEPESSLPETPTPGDKNDDESDAKHAGMQNGTAGGSGDPELDPETLFFR